jgi:flagellar biosynthesis protein
MAQPFPNDGSDAPRRGPLKAVALEYRKGRMKAPRVTAKGKGSLAERLVAAAREHGVPVQEDRMLVEALEAVEVGLEVPAELYQVVAEILVAVYRAERENVSEPPR